MARHTPKSIAVGATYIDPADCGSTIMWKVVDNGYEGASYDCAINLTDCSRLITWHCECDDSGIKKIENAIKTLQEALKATKAGKVLQDNKVAREKEEEKLKSTKEKKKS